MVDFAREGVEFFEVSFELSEAPCDLVEWVEDIDKARRIEEGDVTGFLEVDSGVVKVGVECVLCS